MNFLKKILRQESGMGLLSVLGVASGLMAMSIGALKLNEMRSKSTMNRSDQMNRLGIERVVSSLVSTTESCNELLDVENVDRISESTNSIDLDKIVIAETDYSVGEKFKDIFISSLELEVTGEVDSSLSVDSYIESKINIGTYKTASIEESDGRRRGRRGNRGPISRFFQRITGNSENSTTHVTSIPIFIKLNTSGNVESCITKTESWADICRGLFKGSASASDGVCYGPKFYGENDNKIRIHVDSFDDAAGELDVIVKVDGEDKKLHYDEKELMVSEGGRLGYRAMRMLTLEAPEPQNDLYDLLTCNDGENGSTGSAGADGVVLEGAIDNNDFMDRDVDIARDPADSGIDQEDPPAENNNPRLNLEDEFTVIGNDDGMDVNFSGHTGDLNNEPCEEENNDNSDNNPCGGGHGIGGDDSGGGLIN